MWISILSKNDSELTRWPEVVPIESTKTVSQVLVQTRVFHFGTPLLIKYDRGRQFESILLKTLISLFGVNLAMTASHTRQYKGLIECLYRHLKQTLMFYKVDFL